MRERRLPCERSQRIAVFRSPVEGHSPPNGYSTRKHVGGCLSDYHAIVAVKNVAVHWYLRAVASSDMK